MGSQTTIFSKLVRDFMRASPLGVSPGVSCAEIVARMSEGELSSVIVTGEDGGVLGIVTERDITRRVAFKTSADIAVSQVMTAPVLTADSDDYLYYAIARMRRHNLRHMPVVDGSGALVGMLNLHDALASASAQFVDQIDGLTREGGIEELKLIKESEVMVARDLLADQLPAPEIQGLLTHVNNDIHRRLAERIVGELEAEGWGTPPVEFSLIVMGSGGRGENYLFPDQDNGLILTDYPDDEHDRIDGYFIEFACRLTAALDKVGFPLCRGYVMATNPLWRKTLSQWRQQTRLWGHTRSAVTIRLASIFFDFKSVHGDAGLAAELRHHVTGIMRNNHLFLLDILTQEIEFGTALGLFGRFVVEKENKAYRGQINLKHGGTLPLVNAIRLLALREGIEECATLTRIAELEKRGVLDHDVSQELAVASRHITMLLLRQQLDSFTAGAKVSNYVPPKSLSRWERATLIDSFKAIDRLRERVRSDFTGELL